MGSCCASPQSEPDEINVPADLDTKELVCQSAEAAPALQKVASVQATGRLSLQVREIDDLDGLHRIRKSRQTADKMRMSPKESRLVKVPAKVGQERVESSPVHEEIQVSQLVRDRLFLQATVKAELFRRFEQGPEQANSLADQLELVNQHISEVVRSRINELTLESPPPTRKCEWELILDQRWDDILEWFDLNPSLMSPASSTISVVFSGASSLSPNLSSSDLSSLPDPEPEANDVQVLPQQDVLGQHVQGVVAVAQFVDENKSPKTEDEIPQKNTKTD